MKVFDCLGSRFHWASKEEFSVSVPSEEAALWLWLEDALEELSIWILTSGTWWWWWWLFFEDRSLLLGGLIWPIFFISMVNYCNKGKKGLVSNFRFFFVLEFQSYWMKGSFNYNIFPETVPINFQPRPTYAIVNNNNKNSFFRDDVVYNRPFTISRIGILLCPYSVVDYEPDASSHQ